MIPFIKPASKQFQPSFQNLLLCCPFVLVGAVVFCVGFRDLWRGYTSSQWPQAVGVITQSRAKEGRFGSLVDITYDYPWQGHLNRGSELNAESSSMLSDGRSRYVHSKYSGISLTLNLYPVGKQVQVSVNPDAPEMAMLEPGIDQGPIVFSVFGLIWMSLCGVAIWANVKGLLKTKAKVQASPQQP